jgi:hypothetical protein
VEEEDEDGFKNTRTDVRPSDHCRLITDYSAPPTLHRLTFPAKNPSLPGLFSCEIPLT